MPPRSLTNSLQKSGRTPAEHDIFLAEEKCQSGQYLQALLLTEPYPKHPLACAVRLHIMVARYELTRALEEGQFFLKIAKRTNHLPAMARIHQHLANAAWSLNQKERHQEHLQQAHELATQCNDTRLLKSLEAMFVHNTDTHEALDLDNPCLGLVGSLESRFKTLRLLVRRGEYRLALRALDSALEKRIGGAIKESLKIALGEKLATRLPQTFEHRPWLLANEKPNLERGLSAFKAYLPATTPDKRFVVNEHRAVYRISPNTNTSELQTTSSETQLQKVGDLQ